MGLQDRDYYQDHLRDLERSNEAAFAPRGDVPPRSWLVRAFVVVVLCSWVYLAVQVRTLRSELDAAERIIAQQVAQMRFDRERAARQAASRRVAPEPRPALPPAVNFFNK